MSTRSTCKEDLTGCLEDCRASYLQSACIVSGVCLRFYIVVCVPTSGRLEQAADAFFLLVRSTSGCDREMASSFCRLVSLCPYGPAPRPRFFFPCRLAAKCGKVNADKCMERQRISGSEQIISVPSASRVNSRCGRLSAEVLFSFTHSSWGTYLCTSRKHLSLCARVSAADTTLSRKAMCSAVRTHSICQKKRLVITSRMSGPSAPALVSRRHRRADRNWRDSGGGSGGNLWSARRCGATSSQVDSLENMPGDVRRGFWRALRHEMRAYPFVDVCGRWVCF